MWTGRLAGFRERRALGLSLPRSADSLQSSEGNIPVFAGRIKTVLRMAVVVDFGIVNQHGEIVLLNGCQAVESAKFLGVDVLW
jgi:hypothetical protein